MGRGASLSPSSCRTPLGSWALCGTLLHRPYPRYPPVSPDPHWSHPTPRGPTSESETRGTSGRSRTSRSMGVRGMDPRRARDSGVFYRLPPSGKDPASLKQMGRSWAPFLGRDERKSASTGGWSVQPRGPHRPVSRGTKTVTDGIHPHVGVGGPYRRGSTPTRRGVWDHGDCLPRRVGPPFSSSIPPLVHTPWTSPGFRR